MWGIKRGKVTERQRDTDRHSPREGMKQTDRHSHREGRKQRDREIQTDTVLEKE